MSARARRAAVAAALVSAGAAVALTAPGAASAQPGAHDRAGGGRAVAELRQAIAPYQDLAVALADGFVDTGACAPGPTGAMGRHVVHPGRLAQPLDHTRPPILLYGQDASGRAQLLGAEFLVPDADQDLATDGDRPTLLGQPFDGPMPGHEPGMPLHYDLHVWTHVANPDGVFSPWNPRVSC